MRKMIAAFSKRTLIIVSVVIVSLSTLQANAALIYDWRGDCSMSCTGIATGVLELVDTYVPGTALSPGDVIAWSYSSSSGSYSIPSDLPVSFWVGNLPALSGPPPVSLFSAFGGVAVFNNFTDGEWNTGAAPLLPNVDVGLSSNWTLRSEVPEPGSLASLLLGGLLLWRLRRVT